MRLGKLNVGYVVALCVAVLSPVTSTSAHAGGQPPASPATAPITVTGGVLFGGYSSADAHNGRNRQLATAHLEALALRPLAVERVFYRWEDGCVTDDDKVSVGRGRTLLISWDAQHADKSLPATPWAGIASGRYDAAIDRCAAALAGLAVPVFFTFQHEPETHLGTGAGNAGTAAEYVAAWRHVHDRLRVRGATNVTFVQILMAWTLRHGRGDYYYPGDSYVDYLAADGYNWYGCSGQPGPWNSPTQVFAPFYNWGVAHGKPLIIAEWGTGEDPATPGRKAKWISDLTAMVKGWPQIKVVTIFNSGRVPSCARYADTSTSSLMAYQAMGADPYFHGVMTGGR